MKTLIKETLVFPHGVQFRGTGYAKTLTKIRSLPDRALFWAGALLLTSGALRVENLPE